MDRLVADQCRIEEVLPPKGLAGIIFAYRVQGNGLAPSVFDGDIVCCSEPLPCSEPWPRLAVVHFYCGYKKLIRTRPLGSAISVVSPVRLIIKK